MIIFTRLTPRILAFLDRVVFGIFLRGARWVNLRLWLEKRVLGFVSRLDRWFGRRRA